MIYRHLFSGILAEGFFFFFPNEARIIASKQGRSGVTADGWECFELQGPFRALCCSDQ